jgi:hypothetical protein
MKPTYEEMLNGNVRWREKHREVHIELSFHGYRRGEFQSEEHGVTIFFWISACLMWMIGIC